MMDTGPKVDQAGPSFAGLVDHVGRSVRVGGHRDKAQLLMFTAPSCSTCKSLLPGLRAMARAESGLDVVIISDGTPEEHREFLAGSSIGTELSYVDARDVGIAYQVGTTPYGVILDEHGKIRGKGLTNHMAQVESCSMPSNPARRHSSTSTRRRSRPDPPQKKEAYRHATQRSRAPRGDRATISGRRGHRP